MGLHLDVLHLSFTCLIDIFHPFLIEMSEEKYHLAKKTFFSFF
jgi:hypothetical protein